MNKKLLYIFIIVVILRLVFALSTPYLDDAYSYFHLRQIEHISDKGYPLYNDPLSYGGRIFIFLPLMHYFLALFFAIFKSTYALKIVVNIVAASLVILVYYITYHFTKNKNISLLTSILSAFIPIYLDATLHTLTTKTFIVPLSFLIFYTMIRLDNSRYQLLNIISFVTLIFIDSSSIFILLVFLVYILLLKLEYLPVKPSENELFIFSFFFLVWVYILFFKRELLAHQLMVLWKNIPPQVIQNYFQKITPLQALYNIGFVPFIIGMYMVYHSLFKKKQKDILVFISVIIASTFLIWLRWGDMELNLIYIGVTFMILFGIFLQNFMIFIKKTKFDYYKNIIIALFVMLLALTSVVPALFSSWRTTVTTEEQFFAPFNVLDRFVDIDAKILSSPENGHPIAYYSQRKTAIDTNYLLISNVENMYNDVRTIYQTHISQLAVGLMNKHKIKFIYLSDIERNEFKINQLAYFDSECIEVIPLGKSYLYKNLCGEI